LVATAGKMAHAALSPAPRRMHMMRNSPYRALSGISGVQAC